MHRDERSIDDQVLAALRSPTVSGMPAVMNPKLISRHIGADHRDRLGAEPAGCHRCAQAARECGARATSRQIANLLDGDPMTPSDESSGTAPLGQNGATDLRKGEHVHVGAHLTGVVVSDRPFRDAGHWRLRVEVDGHDWVATPVLEIVRRVERDA